MDSDNVTQPVTQPTPSPTPLRPMISLAAIAPREKLMREDLPVEDQDGKLHWVTVEFYPNRITPEPYHLPESDDADDLIGATGLRNATAYCHQIKSWNLAGPVVSNAGVELVAETDIVPLEPRIVRCIPTWVTGAISQEMIIHAFPQRRGEIRSRPRS